MPTKRNVTVRLFLKILASAALLAALLLWFGSPAAAKGPVSATISGPGIEEPLELVDEDSRALMSKLMEQTGLWYATGDLPRPIEAPPGDLGPAYTLTWVNGGPPHRSVEARTMVQYLYLQAEGGALIHTPEQDSLQKWGQGVIGWFAAPEGLPGTLLDLGAPAKAVEARGASPANALWVVGVAAILIMTGIGYSAMTTGKGRKDQ